MCILKNRGGQTVQDAFTVKFDGERYVFGDLEDDKGSGSLMDYMRSSEGSSEMNFDSLFDDSDFGFDF